MAQTTSGCGTGGGGCGAIMGISDMKPTRSSDVIVYVIDSSASLAAAAAAAAADLTVTSPTKWRPDGDVPCASRGPM